MRACIYVLLGSYQAIFPSELRAASVDGASPKAAQYDDARTATGPDAHILRPSKGDVIDVRKPLGRNPGRSYVPPYADWRFVRVTVGQRLRPAFFAPRYQVADAAGRVAARGSHRWIRYGPDLLLVNIRTGSVLRVIPDRYG